MKRRDFLKYSLMAGLSASLPDAVFANDARNAVAQQKPFPLPAPAGPVDFTGAICMFSKPLDHFSHEEMAEIVAGAGYDGIDLTFRGNGHIRPGEGKSELPKFVRIAQKAGLTVPMAATDILSADDPAAEDTIRMMADNGITHYRIGFPRYDFSVSIPENLDRFRRQFSGLCELNARYGVRGYSQNHAGNFFNASVWDAWTVLKDLDARHFGIQYDIRHAMAEGMQSWEQGFRAVAGMIGTICIKDFVWNRRDDGRFVPLTVPLGEGAVDFGYYFGLLRKFGISCPASVHFEYPLLAAGQQELPAARQMGLIRPVLNRDLEKLRSFLQA